MTNKFGWDLPPGCTQRHIDEAFGGEGVTALQDDILKLLEKADIAEKFCDEIMALVAAGETDRTNRDDAAMIDQLVDEARDRRMWEEPLNETEGDQYSEDFEREMQAHHDWKESQK